MKKHNLFKVVGISILVVVLLTWILPTTYYSYGLVSDGTRSQVGLFDLLNYPKVSLSYFGNIAIYILTIGGFYGVLHKIGAYRSLLDKIAKKLKGKEKIVLSIIMILLAVFTSVCGASLGLLIIVPFIISLILLMGYDKVTAAMVTVGSIAVGLIGTTVSSTYVTDSYSLVAQNGMGIVNAILGTQATDQIIAKIILLVLGLALLIFNTLRHAGKNHNPKKLEEEYLPKVTDKKSKTWPLVLIFDLIFVIAMLSLTSWSSVFKLDWFTTATDAIKNFKIGGFAIFGKLLGSVGAFEQWTVIEIGVLLVIGSIILSLIYKVKFNDYFDNIIEGAKKAIKPAVLIILIYVVLVIVSNHPITLTIVKPLLTLTKGLNAFTMSLSAFIASVLNVDMYYAASSVLPYVTELITDTSLSPIIALIWQAIYGFSTLLAPTSIILIAILSYLDIPYGKWLKSNWKLILEILALCLIVFTIVILVV